MTQRYYAELPARENEFELEGAEAHHLLHVMRARLGDRITVFDGGGKEFDTEVVHLDRRTARVKILECRSISRELTGELIVGVAIPKSDRQRFLVEKLVELGVHRLVPLQTERTQGGARGNQGLDKLDRTVIEACKQCGRNQLMVIEAMQEARTFFSRYASADVRWIAHPVDSLSMGQLAKPAALLQLAIAIGPEGGWTDSEILAAKTNAWQCVGLGRRILRVETAACLLAGYWSQQLEAHDAR